MTQTSSPFSKYTDMKTLAGIFGTITIFYPDTK